MHLRASCGSPAGTQYELYIELACNGMFGCGGGGFIRAPDPDRTFTIAQAELAVHDNVGANLIADVTTLYDLARHMPDR